MERQQALLLADNLIKILFPDQVVVNLLQSLIKTQVNVDEMLICVNTEKTIHPIKNIVKATVCYDVMVITCF